jgi:hypothetical protein
MKCKEKRKVHTFMKREAKELALQMATRLRPALRRAMLYQFV